MARKLWPDGIHVALIVIDGVVDLPAARLIMPDDAFVDPNGVAEIAFHCASNRDGLGVSRLRPGPTLRSGERRAR
jgi:hypothetical protein